ncbi:MAG: hypothetical protein IKN57_13615, partial [Parasporobacterium sp.]|nr:hypothetical protein [Parasporobacterium sp.]
GILFLWLLQKIDCRIRAILPGVLFFIACISAKYVWLPFSLQAGCCALFYQYAGFLYKRLAIWARDGQDADAGKDSLRMLFHETGAAYIVFAFAAWFGFIRNFQSFWLVRCETGRGASDVFGSLCACSCVFFVSYILEKNKYVSAVLRPVAYLGKNSIYMLGAHILELNFFPWQIFKDGLHKWGMPVEFDLYVVIAAKFLWIIPASVLLSRSRFLKKIFGQFG